jgi:hypothetical protein
MIYVVSDKYCFVDAPESIKKEISDMGNDKISLNCSLGSKKVCFGFTNCDIYVNYGQGTVKKDRETLTFSGDAMMYAAVFSSNSVYKCNMGRMMKRLAIQTDMNVRKAEKLGFDGCATSSVRSSLLSLKGAAEGASDSNSLRLVNDLAKEVQGENPSQCPIF